MRVAISQSNYLPWKGYFDLIHHVDVFVFYEDVQYTKNTWRHRNRVKTAQGLRWLSVPVGAHIHRRLDEVVIRDARWQRRHWRTLREAYARAPHFERHRAFLDEVYGRREWRSLSELNRFLIETIAREFLGMRTEFRCARDYAAEGRNEDRVLNLLRALGARCYVSGPAAKAYLHAERFADAGIELEWKDYSGYPEYPQLHGEFEHAVTILDLLFHAGPEAPHYIWGWRA
jgi:hypothetical protein